MKLISLWEGDKPTRLKLRLHFRRKTGSQSQLPVIPALFGFGNTATIAGLEASAVGSGLPGGPGSERLTPRPLAPGSTRSRLLPPPPEVRRVGEETPAEEQLPQH